MCIGDPVEWMQKCRGGGNTAASGSALRITGYTYLLSNCSKVMNKLMYGALNESGQSLHPSTTPNETLKDTSPLPQCLAMLEMRRNTTHKSGTDRGAHAYLQLQQMLPLLLV